MQSLIKTVAFGLALTACGAESRSSSPQAIIAQPILRPFPRQRFTPANAPDVDLRPSIAQLGLGVRSQGSRGTCSVFAMTFLIEYTMSKSIGAGLDLSEEFLNYASNRAINANADGGFFTDLDKGYEQFGIAAEADLPYRPSFEPNLGVRPNILAKADAVERAQFQVIKPWNPNQGASDAQLQSMMTALNFGHPVAVGMLWPNAGADFETVAGLSVMKVPAARADVFDGHSVVIVGYKKSNLFAGGGYAVIRNSWGTGFGDSGYAYLPFAYLKSYANDLVYYHF